VTTDKYTIILSTPLVFLIYREVHLNVMSYFARQMEELPSPYGDCNSSEDYVQSICWADCQADYVIGKCNCKEEHMRG